jgi:hypothetical protein
MIGSARDVLRQSRDATHAVARVDWPALGRLVAKAVGLFEHISF